MINVFDSQYAGEYWECVKIDSSNCLHHSIPSALTWTILKGCHFQNIALNNWNILTAVGPQFGLRQVTSSYAFQTAAGLKSK
jgi:hypothetical protein